MYNSGSPGLPSINAAMPNGAESTVLRACWSIRAADKIYLQGLMRKYALTHQDLARESESDGLKALSAVVHHAFCS